MAIPISDEELQLKKRARRRLIGAIALVTVVAVFLPMVLDHEPKPVTQDISIQIPSQNAGTFTSKIVPVVPGGADARAAPAEPAGSVPPLNPPDNKSAVEPPSAPPAAKTAAAEPKAAAPAEPKAKSPPAADSEAAPPKAPVTEAKAKPKAEAKPKPEAKPEAKPKSAAKEGGSFVVQVAALTDVDKANQMREQIAGAGVKAYTEVVPTTKGNVTRVRAGPFASRDAAEKARERLKELGLAGNVVPK
jgi:DedD protein